MSLVQSSSLSKDEIQSLIRTVSWYHSVELLPGIVAPGSLPRGGRYDIESSLRFVQENSGGLAGKRILEIGTWDGPMAYKLKSLGCDVVATDIQDPTHTGFEITGKITGLNVPYVRCSVYELPKHFEQEFDVVLFLGVFYHLKYPILAFERIAQVLKPGGRVLVMGSGVSHRFETLEGKEISAIECEEFRRTLDRMDAAGVPLCLAYPGTFVKGDNWFMPNRTALKGWMTAAGFKVGHVYGNASDYGTLALSGWAERILSEPVREHGLMGAPGGYTSDLAI